MAGEYTITLSDGVTQFNLYPLEVNGPGAYSTPRFIQLSRPEFTITGADAVTDYFKVDGNQLAHFTPGYKFEVAGSPSNDGIYTIQSAALDGFGDTIVYTVESIPTSTVGGDIGIFVFKLNDDLTYRFVAGFQFDVVGSGGGSNDGTYTVASTGATFNGTHTVIPTVELIPNNALPFGKIKYLVPLAEVATPFSLPGKGQVNFGHTFITNSVRHLENFANNVAPANPMLGQLWYNTATETLNLFDGSAFSASVNLGTDALKFVDPQHDVNPGSFIYISGDDAVSNDVGITVRPETDPTTNGSIFRVIGALGDEFLRVEAGGFTSTVNALRVYSTNQSVFDGDIRFADTKGIVATGGAKIISDGTGRTWEIHAGFAGAAPLQVKNSTGVTHFQVRGDSTVEVINDLIVDTDTLVVDSANDRVGVNIVPAVEFHVAGDTIRLQSVGDATLELMAPLGQTPNVDFFVNSSIVGNIEVDAFNSMNINSGVVSNVSIAGGGGAVHIGGTAAATAKLEVTGTTLLDGAVDITAALDMNSQLINNVLDPVGVQDAATKNYVDVTVGAAVAGVDQLQKLNDVVNDATSTASMNNVLYFDGAKWDNHALVSTDITDFTEAVQDAVGTSAIVAGVQNGITVSYDDINNQYDFDVDDFIISLSGDVTGSNTVTNLGNVTIATTVSIDSTKITDFTEAVQDAVGTLAISTGVQNGISVTYDDINNQYDFDVDDFTLTVDGDVSGNATITNLTNTTLTITVLDDSHSHDTQYYTKALLDGGQLDTRYYTETEVDSLLSAKAPLVSPALTGTPTAPTAPTTTNTTQIATTAFVQQEIGSVSTGFSSGQTWQDVSGSRSLGVTYTNTTGNPIQIAVETDGTTTFTVGALTVASVPGGTTLTAIIPNGATYSVTTAGSTISRWNELR